MYVKTGSLRFVKIRYCTPTELCTRAAVEFRRRPLNARVACLHATSACRLDYNVLLVLLALHT
jgi:hypothetical protein